MLNIVIVSRVSKPIKVHALSMCNSLHLTKVVWGKIWGNNLCRYGTMSMKSKNGNYRILFNLTSDFKKKHTNLKIKKSSTLCAFFGVCIEAQVVYIMNYCSG